MNGVPDREKVIKGMEICYCHTEKCKDCSYHNLELCYNALYLDALSLLKEQEAVEPECQIIFDVPYYFCGSCKTMLNMYAVKAKYCSNCGRRVKWDDSK